jgi:hypothetical protein
MDSSFTAATDVARKRQEERYQKYLREQEAFKATQAFKDTAETSQVSQRVTQEAAAQAAATQEGLEDHYACRQRVLLNMRKYKCFSPFDWAATRLQRFFRIRQSLPKLSKPSEPVMFVGGEPYMFYSEASQLFDARAPPFDSLSAQSEYVTLLMKIQSSANFASQDNKLSAFHQVVFFLSCVSREIRPDVGLLFGVFDFDIINQMLSLNLSDYPKLSRNIKLLNLLLNGQIPDYIFQHFPSATDLEEFIDFFRQEVLSEMEKVGSSQSLLAETLWKPNPDDEIQCENCPAVNQARNMFKLPQGRFYYCRRCAPMIGIFPDDF